MISNALWSDDGLAETLRDDGRSRRRRAPPRGSARLDSPGVLSNSLTAFWITLVALVGGTFVLALGVLALSGMLSFTADLTLAETAVVALVLGVVMTAQSPSVVVALRAGGSVVVGLFVGVLIGLYLGRVRDGAPLFVLMVAFVVAEVGARIGLDPLLVALSAGMLIRNVTGQGGTLHDAIEGTLLPVYVQRDGRAVAVPRRPGAIG